MKKHQSLLEYVSPNKRRRTNAIRKDGGYERQLSKQQQQQQNISPSVCCWMDYESIESTQCFSSTTMIMHHSNNALPFTINTQIASSTTTEIFLSRLHKEIIQPFRFTLSSQIQLLDSDRSVHDATERRHVIQKRILFGYNEVSKLLFDSNIGKTTKPSLIVIVNPDNVHQQQQQQQQQQHPSSTSTIGAAMLQHIPFLSYQMNIPLLLLPSSYSSENQIRGKVETEMINTLQALATTFGCGHHSNYYDMKQFSCIAFTYHDQSRQLVHNFENGIVKGFTDDDLEEYKQNEHLLHIHNTIDSFVSYITNKIQN